MESEKQGPLKVENNRLIAFYCAYSKISYLGISYFPSLRNQPLLKEELKEISMRNLLLSVVLVCYTIIGFGQHTNIEISNISNINEPCIMFDPKHPEIMIAGANTDNYFLSQDSGMTWTSHKLTSPFGVWGDPVIVVDTNSDFYFFHLSNPPAGSWIDRIVCQKTTDNGQNWTSGTHMGKDGTKAQDKEWAIIDRTNNNIYVTWTQFDNYGSNDPADSSSILFSKSIDNGLTWTPAKRINKTPGDCVDSDNTVEGAVPALGPNGELYVGWVGPDGIVLDRSTDQGDTWLDDDIFVTDVPGGWEFTIPGLNRCNGLPVTKCDVSGGPNNGTIYINWTDQRNGTDDTDVWLVKSTDGGDTWSSPVRVNDDTPGKHQFLTWMDVDQVTGYLYFVFYDRRNHSDNQTDVYMAVSTDGGQSFQNVKISEDPFTPRTQMFFGDYTNIVAHNHLVRPIWTSQDNFVGKLFTAIVDVPSLVGHLGMEELEKSVPELEQNFPNPVKDITNISYKLYKNSKVTLSLYDITGRKKGVLLNDVYHPYGKHSVKVSTQEYGLTNGIYFYELTTENKVIRKKMIILN